MRFLSVADRELRSAARQKATYRIRWITAALFFVLQVWLLWAFNGFSNRRLAPQIFNTFAFLTFLYCLFIAMARTADCISAERRDGTLGFLFLTNLNSAEIIAGKLCSSALASVYGLMAIFPMLALPLLMGGITFGRFACTVVGLLNGILFGLAAGFLASVLCKRQFTAVALAMGLTISFAGGLMLGAAAANSYAPTRYLAPWLAVPSPLYTLIAADGARFLGSNLFWLSAAVVAGFSLLGLGLSTLLLALTWRDRPETFGPWRPFRFGERSDRSPSAGRAALRRRLLAINPVFWLAGRKPLSAPVFMALAVTLSAITVYVAAPFFSRVMATSATAPQVLGHLFAWLCTGLAIHALVLYYAAMSASQRLAEDKQTGALELILCSPATERTISRGLWLAYARKMFFPALFAILVHLYFLWICMVMATLDPPGPVPPGATPGEIFWSALLNQPLRGRFLDWEFGFMLRCALLILLQLILTWPTLGWVGRWLGLRMKHSGLAPLASLALLIVPPVLLFSFACYLLDKLHLTHLPDRRFLPIMMWLALAIGIGHCVTLSIWAATRLRYHLRPIAMSRYQPLPPWRWRLPSRRTVRLIATAATALLVLAVSLVVSYYGYQNWRAQHAWKTFQVALNKRGETLNLSAIFPPPVPTGSNFARSPAFVTLVSGTNAEIRDLFERMASLAPPANPSQANWSLLEWSRQYRSTLSLFVDWDRLKLRPGRETNRIADATSVLKGLQPHDQLLRELAAAAARFPGFQVSTNRDIGSVLHPVPESILMLERLHMLFQVRACASLALNRNAEPAEDLLTGLRLASLARQLPDSRSAIRVQVLLTRSFQPLWEGLAQHAWTEPQLAILQQELARFTPLSDYTNALHRVVLAYIELWRAIPARNNSPTVFSASGPSINSDSKYQPRAWWFDNCIQLHQAEQHVLEQVNVAACKVAPPVYGNELDGLPLDSASRDMLQQVSWYAATPANLAFVQTSLNQAIIACALERFRLANSTYPEALGQLVPAFLDRVPHDAVSGRPLIYQLLGPDTFILRGVGPNGLDDRNKTACDDWLWSYTNVPPAQKPGKSAPKR